MSALNYVQSTVIPAAFSLLPPKMDSVEARAMLLAIGLQESRFQYRRQIGGPARGFWQFEEGGGVHGVMEHPDSQTFILGHLRAMSYDMKTRTSYEAIADNDILACLFARLLLWTHPKPLPKQGDNEKAWQYYLWLWRPGKPHRQTWDAFYDEAWGKYA